MPWRSSRSSPLRAKPKPGEAACGTRSGSAIVCSSRSARKPEVAAGDREARRHPHPRGGVRRAPGRRLPDREATRLELRILIATMANGVRGNRLPQATPGAEPPGPVPGAIWPGPWGSGRAKDFGGKSLKRQGRALAWGALSATPVARARARLPASPSDPDGASRTPTAPNRSPKPHLCCSVRRSAG